MQLEIGKEYKNGFGEVIKIVTKDEFDENVFVDSVGRSYYSSGRYFYSKVEEDDRNILF